MEVVKQRSERWSNCVLDAFVRVRKAFPNSIVILKLVPDSIFTQKGDAGRYRIRIGVREDNKYRGREYLVDVLGDGTVCLPSNMQAHYKLSTGKYEVLETWVNEV